LDINVGQRSDMEMNTADKRNPQISEKTTMQTVSPNEKAIIGDKGFSLIELMIACFVWASAFCRSPP
jgi:hypothetical protein